jgi:drug/metabolite transporter (DMT)-like permease
MLGVLLAAGSALMWGVGDFSGGKASQRADAVHVTAVAMVLALPVLVVLVLAYPGSHVRPADLAWGALGGLSGGAGIALFYRGLAGGAMAVVAPVSAVTSASLPLLLGLAIDRVPGTLALTGAVIAVVAIGLVSVGGRGGPVTVRVVGLALAAGALFGTFFVCLRQASPDAGAWPLVAQRFAAAAAFWGLLAWRRTAPRLRTVWAWTVAAGVLDVGANALYLAAVHHGALSVIAPVAALYPAGTVLLALAVERERMRPIQVAGLGLAATALVLTASQA